jgi:hypothetical protein
LWLDFAAEPTRSRWYRAHNASIVAAYIEHRDLAEQDPEPERFFVNVALGRVLYAHALAGAPRLALGRFAAFGGVLGDPRLGMAGAFLSLSRVLPDRYPLDLDVERYIADEQHLAACSTRPFEQRHVWQTPAMPLAGRVLERVTRAPQQFS